MKIIFASLLLAALFIFMLIRLTDRVCDKPFSEEYKQTAEYKAMQCPN